jgi:hypothetical protein
MSFKEVLMVYIYKIITSKIHLNNIWKDNICIKRWYAEKECLPKEKNYKLNSKITQC